MLRELESVPGLQLVTAGIDSSARRRPSARDLWRRRRLAWTLYNRLASRRATSLAPTDLSDRLADIDTVQLASRREGSWQFIEPEGCRHLASHQPDFLLRFGFGLIRGPILEATPLGVWSFHHGDERSQRGGPPCFWELVLGEPITGVLLQRLNERIDGGTPLARAFFPTVPHSYRRNRDQAYLGAVELPAQVCRGILAGSALTDERASGSQAPVRRPPDWRTLARFAPRLAANWCRRQFDGLARADRWHVGVVDRPLPSLLSDPHIGDARWLPRPDGANRYVADPFGIETRDGGVMLVEDFDHDDRHGRLAAYRFGPDGTATGPHPVREFDSHVSYPYLFDVDGQWWCVPESSAARELRAHQFDPATLELGEGVLLLSGRSLTDPTLFRWAERWWLLATDRDRGANTHLRGWWADHPLGPWHQHAVDPLAIDVRGARGAGTPFVVDGVLYRPAQDSTHGYGAAVAIKKVVELSPTCFREERAATVAPDPDGPYPHGLHTLSGYGTATLVDGAVSRFSIPAFRHELTARVRRVLAP